ncbi:MAG: signal peptide peptidase SppA [Candidatus Diapherotrites archaeon]|nr:signal peptide peptidase SppA [Candidatus Diapherotrites archaeon]
MAPIPKPAEAKTSPLRMFALLVALVIAGAFIVAVLLSLSSGSGLPTNGVVAVIPLKGEIGQGFAGEAGFSLEEGIELLQEAENDFTVAAIVLDIDSPGGSVVASKQLAYKIRSMKKPIVSWIGETGASGAYYAAAASTWIAADADSITGSIGVLSMAPNVQALLEKIGVKMEVLHAGNLKAMGSPFKELSEEERAILQTILDETFETFKSDVISFRGSKLNVQDFNQVADGRILSGRQALKAGLIDALGSKEDAIQKAADLAGIQGKPETKTLETEKFALSDLFLSMGASLGKGFRQGFYAQNAAPKIRS